MEETETQKQITELAVLRAKFNQLFLMFLAILGLIIGSGVMNNASNAKVTAGLSKISERVARIETKVEPQIKIQWVYSPPAPPIVYTPPPPMITALEGYPPI